MKLQYSTLVQYIWVTCIGNLRQIETRLFNWENWRVHDIYGNSFKIWQWEVFLSPCFFLKKVRKLWSIRSFYTVIVCYYQSDDLLDPLTSFDLLWNHNITLHCFSLDLSKYMLFSIIENWKNNEIPYRGIVRQGKVKKFLLDDENFPRQKVYPAIFFAR